MKRIIKNGGFAYTGSIVIGMLLILKGACLYLNILMLHPYILIGLMVFDLLIIYYLVSSGKKIDALWKNIRTPAAITIDRDNLPKKDGHVFVGYGSEYDKDEVEQYLQFSKLPSDEVKAENPILGGQSLMHGLIMGKEKPIFMPLTLLNQHSLFLGTTGVGKTRSLEVLAIQAIERIKEGECVFVLDPKGDAALLNLIYNTLSQMGDEYADKFKYFSLPHPRQSCKYNPLENYAKPSDIADRIAPLMGSGGGNSETFIKYCWDVINVICQLLDYMGKRITLKDIDKYALRDQIGLLREAFITILNMDPENLKTESQVTNAATQFSEKVSRKEVEDIEPLSKYIEFASRPKENYQKMVNSLKPVMSMLASGDIGNLLSPDEDDGDVFSWKDFVDKGGVTYFYLGSLIGKETATNVGKLTLLDLKSMIGSVYAYKDEKSFVPVNVFVDETSQVVVPELIDLLNQGRGAGLRMTLFTQTTADLEARLGQKAMAQQLIENCNNNFQFRNQTKESAQKFSEQCGNRMVDFVNESKSVSPGFGGTGNSLVGAFAITSTMRAESKEVPIVSTDMIGGLPIGQCFANFASTAYKLRTPLFKKVENDVDYLKMIGAK